MASVNRQTDARIIWKASDAWLCALVLIALQLCIDGWLRIGARLNPSFAHWLSTVFSRGAFMVLDCVLWLLIAFWFARVQSVHQFLGRVGLRRRLTLSGWSAAWGAIAIGLLGRYAVAKGWAPPSQSFRAFWFGGAVARWFFILRIVLIVPVYEEIAMRGFLYRAFRGSYGRFISTALVLCVVTFFHWGLVSRAVLAFVCVESGAILLCVIRERTGNLWNCIVFHAAYNATGFLSWPVYVIGMILLFPYCSQPTGTLLSGRSGEESESSEASSVDTSC
jgi:membrane protease YdiL (CAAX protease family)